MYAPTSPVGATVTLVVTLSGTAVIVASVGLIPSKVVIITSVGIVPVLGKPSAIQLILIISLERCTLAAFVPELPSTDHLAHRAGALKYPHAPFTFILVETHSYTQVAVTPVGLSVQVNPSKGAGTKSSILGLYLSPSAILGGLRV